MRSIYWRLMGKTYGVNLLKPGEVVFRHACKMGLEGIVSKRRDSRDSSGVTPNWVKSKNPNSAAVEREATEDWGKS
jgi:ATP-dependent DNA ligase